MDKYIKLDDDKLLNKEYIRWILHKNDCIYFCSRDDGCRLGTETNTVCKNAKEYNNLLLYFYGKNNST